MRFATPTRTATEVPDFDRAYPVLSMLGLGLVSAILATFGQRVSRLLLLGTGSTTAIFWYVAALAAGY